jgi:hypothetical protein
MMVNHKSNLILLLKSGIHQQKKLFLHTKGHTIFTVISLMHKYPGGGIAKIFVRNISEIKKIIM